jgi:hypothetical protein
MKLIHMPDPDDVIFDFRTELPGGFLARARVCAGLRGFAAKL